MTQPGVWPGEKFGFRTNGGVHARGYYYDDSPQESHPSVGDVVQLGHNLFRVTHCTPKPGTVFGEELVEMSAEIVREGKGA